ncbi:JmjC domain-containing protein [Polaromonas sp. SM01]|uniref:JmjC domain-containing protein n=1 Tax=Polaromonas sp. SM01 TaxID=3085630 RepID=UPI0029829B4F|nr:cupin domain-containing protein [Polaromonas sp. SM01]MDW5442973.1 cupin domain-containing protein [Polaromonas sp. SM01]
MDVTQALTLLGGLTPQQFMRRHWQKKPLLVRQAMPGFKPVLSRSELFKLAAQQEVESRLVQHQAKGWRMKQGPFGPRSLPPLATAAWTLLVQGVDMHDTRAHALLQNFRFVPDARLDDLMISFATAGGGVGPHFDSYDVFLLQASGRRRWKISKQKDLTLQDGVPLKILQNFEPEQEFVLEAGDMLYLPPRYAHDGLAESCTGEDDKTQDCMTYSIGFRAPKQAELAGELLQRLADFHGDEESSGRQLLYRDPSQAATDTPAALPSQLFEFAQQAVHDALKDPLALACVLGEYLTEPKASVWFEESTQAWSARHAGGVRLDARTRMMYDSDHVFINGESYRAKGADALLMRRLADQRGLALADLRKASTSAQQLLADWHEAGWLFHPAAPG